MSHQPSGATPERLAQNSSVDYFGDLRARARGTPTRSNTRPGLGLRDTSGLQDPSSPASPRTPLLQRSFSSAFNSPGNVFRTDDDIIVLEVGSRVFRVGLGGEDQPRCRLSHGPGQQRRVGDYSAWMSTQDAKPVPHDLEQWGHDHELWRMDLRGLDLGLVADKLERAIRTAMIDHVLVMDESKKRSLVLAVSPTLPHPLLSTMLETFFTHYPYPPSIALMSSPILSVIAAGLRSGLVIDVGWEETTITAIFELREVRHERSVRAMKALSRETAKLLSKILKPLSASPNESEDGDDMSLVSLEEAEEVMHRMIWCQSHSLPSGSAGPSERDASIAIPIAHSSSPMEMPFSQLYQPVDSALFGVDPSSDSSNTSDIHELPISYLAYSVLLNLAVDVRDAVLPRVLITGGGSNIPGLKTRIMADLADLIHKEGRKRFDRVRHYGSCSGNSNQHAQRQPSQDESSAAQVEQIPINKDTDKDSTTPAYLQPSLKDEILERIHARANKSWSQASNSIATPENGNKAPLRCVESLGPWAGASLAAGLRLKGLVEIDRDVFLQHGLLPPEHHEASKRKSNVFAQNQQQRQSLGGPLGNGTGKVGERDGSAWTLGAWA
ncbi:MAG: hypothetical protein M1828_005210 [Chrysothrix sp. TS-e1954]|nr:MAG: hypothetical protein M1828_005210 [Chrysothrix sp. TS-e1954]